jgi:hypothetical protein
MPKNTDNYTLTVPKQTADGGANVAATDVHISATHASVDVRGIGGVDPNGPTSPHSVGIDNQGAIDIDHIEVQPGEDLVIRLTHTRDNRRLRFTYRWSYPEGVKGNTTDFKVAMVLDPGEDPALLIAGNP